jgi:drug/metabolite transporter (DMT)-like permease
MSARSWTIFAAVSLLWGIPYLFIKIAVNGGVTPGLLAWGRVTIAAVVLLALARRSGSLRALRGRWKWLAVYGIVEISIPFPPARRWRAAIARW